MVPISHSLSFTMKRRDIILVCSLLAAIVVGMFTYTYIVREQVVVPTVSKTPTSTVENRYNITRIEGKHFYRNGVHTIIGEVMLPTPCDLLTYDARIAESLPEQVTFAFGVTNNSDVCAQVVTAQRFMVSATATAAAELKATFSGMPVELNLIEAAPNENFADFELFIKG